MHRYLLFALLPLLLAGCKHVPSRAECNTHGGTPWRELKSAHFRLSTNLDSETAKLAIIELEKVRRGLLFAWRDAIDPPGRMDAVILQSKKQLEEFAEEEMVGFMTEDRRGKIVVMAGESYSFNATPDRRVLTHELAHYLSSYVMSRQPRWFGEGLAGYLEMTRPYGDGSEVRLGEVHPEMIIWAKTHARVPLEDLWRWKGNTDLRDAESMSYYTTSWLWVHFLINQHPKEFADFQSRLGRGEEPEEAWRQALKGIDPEMLNRELNEYLAYGRYSAIRVKMPKVPEATSERLMSDGEVHALRARLFRLRAKKINPKVLEAVAERESREAKELSPDDFETLLAVWGSRKSGPERLETAREIVQKHPENSDAWLLIHISLPDDAAKERREALIKSVQFDPESARALNALAWDYALSGQGKVAVPLASKAVKLAPWNAAIVDTYAAALAAAGRCPEAVATQRRAIDMLHESTSAEQRKDYEERLADYEGGCRKALAPTSSGRAP
jgi:tetratricopeptide (TPR) repeat protein